MSLSGNVRKSISLDRTASISTDARYVLVVEKDAIFQRLLADNVFRYCGPGILVTVRRFLTSESSNSMILHQGKGYPDIATRQFLRILSRTCPSLPIHALVDADPYGLDIFLVYKYGSKKSPRAHLDCPAINLLGLLPSELSLYDGQSRSNEIRLTLSTKIFG